MRARRQAPDLGELRRLAVRRRTLGDRARRILPGVIVGSTTLVGSGALAAWVNSQPGLGTTAGHVTARPAATTTTTDPLHSLQQSLQADETALRALESGLPAVTPAAPTPVPGGATPVPVTAPAIAPLPQIAIPSVPHVVASPAPAVNATTGASHAIP